MSPLIVLALTFSCLAVYFAYRFGKLPSPVNQVPLAFLIIMAGLALGTFAVIWATS